MPIFKIMRDDFRAVTRLPVLTQFLLAPFPALLSGLAYGAWRWTQSDWGVQADRSNGYHQLGWTVLPLTALASILFVFAIDRGIKGKRSERLLASALLIAATAVVLAYARTSALGV